MERRRILHNGNRQKTKGRVRGQAFEKISRHNFARRDFAGAS